MKRVLASIALLLALASPSQAAITAGAHTSACTNGGNTTTAAINTTGASLLIVLGGGFSAPSISDSASNSWTALTDYPEAGGSQPRVKFYYVVNPTTSATHTVTNTVGGDNCVAFFAVNGAKTSSPFDVQNGATTAGATSHQPGSVTPSENNEIVVAGFSAGSTAEQPGAIAGYTTIENAVANYRIALAYQIQTTATATNPTWAWTSATQAAANIATFKVAAATTARPLVIGGGVF